MKKILILLTIIFSFIGTSYAQKDEISEKLSALGIDENLFKNSLNEESAKYLFKTKTTATTSSETNVEVAEFDPRRTDGEKWKLISVNGNEPSKKHIKQFNKNHNVDQDNDFGEPESSWEILKDDEEFLVFEMQYADEHLPQKYKYLASCKSKVFVDKQKKQLDRMEFKNIAPIKIKIFNVSELEMTIFFDKKDDENYVIKEETILMKTKLLGQDVEINEDVEFFDYQKVK